MGLYLDRQILFVFLIPVWIAIRIILFKQNKNAGAKFSAKREILLNIFFIYVLCLAGVTLFPLMISFEREHYFISVNLMPVIGTLKEVTNITSDPNMHSFMVRFWIKNIGGNILLLLPAGIMAPILWSRLNNLKKTAFFAFCLSLGIETLQQLSFFIGNTGRAFDIDDILLNTLGAAVGFVLYSIFIKNKPASN